LNVPVIKTLCKDTAEILRAESRVIKVNLPVFVLGDISGNINDLLTFEEQMWRMAPQTNQSNVLFEGDYVDRGEYGLEVALYLFLMKILVPNELFLLRGNHEIKTIQMQFTFYNECRHKSFLMFSFFLQPFDQILNYQRLCFNRFGETDGRKVFELIVCLM
jgi:hypothetical protein